MSTDSDFIKKYGGNTGSTSGSTNTGSSSSNTGSTSTEDDFISRWTSKDYVDSYREYVSNLEKQQAAASQKNNTSTSNNTNTNSYKKPALYDKDTEGMKSTDYDPLITEAENKLKSLKAKRSQATTNKLSADLAGWATDDLTTTNLQGDDYTSLENEIADLTEELDSLKAGKWAAEGKEKYSNLSANADYAEKSKEIDTSRNKIFGGDATYTYINDLNGYDDIDVGEKRSLKERNAGANMLKYSYMTEEETDNYNYLYSTQGKEAANDYLDYISYDLDKRRITQYNEDIAEWASKSTGNAILASAASTGANLFSGLGLADVAVQNAVRGITGEYKPINYYSPYMNSYFATNSIRGTVASNVAAWGANTAITDESGYVALSEEEHPVLAKIFNGKNLGEIYQLGMSMADSASVGAIAGPFGSVILGGSAGTQGIFDALEKGATDSEALTMGVLNATFETLFEYASLDNLINGSTGQFWRDFAAQSFVEGDEEKNTTLFNTVAEILVLGEKSDYMQSINKYMQAGYSQKEAELKTVEDIAIGMGWDFFGGALTGGIMGGTSSFVNNARDARSYGAEFSSKAQDIVNKSNELNPGNETAQKVQKKIDSGKYERNEGGAISNAVQAVKDTFNGGQLRELVTQNDKTTIKNAASEQLTKYGETGDVSSIAEAITKKIAGDTLTKAEERTISNSKYGQRVVNELTPENIKSGQYNSEWAQNINTDKINADVYSKILEEADNNTESNKRQTFAENTNSQQENTNSTANATETTNNTSTTTEAKVNNTAAPSTNSTSSNANSTVSNTATNTTTAGTDTTTSSGATVESASKAYGAQAGAFVHTYQKGQDVTKYNDAYKLAYEYGKTATPFDAVKDTDGLSYLTETQRELAYKAGEAASTEAAKSKAEANKAAAKNKGGIWNSGSVKYDSSYKGKGSVKGEAVSISDLSGLLPESVDKQIGSKIYRTLSKIAEATGINIVLYKSEAGTDNKFHATQGAYNANEDAGTIYVDINAGLSNVTDINDVGKYMMLYTFSHEFVHFMENWSPEQYNELRKLVFSEMHKNGADVDALISAKMKGNRTREYASREVVAEGLSEMLPQSSFVEKLYSEHRSIFGKLLDKLAEFVEDIKAYFAKVKGDPRNMEAQALKAGEQYAENIVRLFNNVANDAVHNYQKSMPVVKTAADIQAELNSPEAKAEKAAAEVTGPRDSTGKAVPESVENKLKDSKARNKQGRLYRVFHGQKSHHRGVSTGSAIDGNSAFFGSSSLALAASYSNSNKVTTFEQQNKQIDQLIEQSAETEEALWTFVENCEAILPDVLNEVLDYASANKSSKVSAQILHDVHHIKRLISEFARTKAEKFSEQYVHNWAAKAKISPEFTKSKAARAYMAAAEMAGAISEIRQVFEEKTKNATGKKYVPDDTYDKIKDYITVAERSRAEDYDTPVNNLFYQGRDAMDAFSSCFVPKGANISYYADLKNPLVIDCKGSDWQAIVVPVKMMEGLTEHDSKRINDLMKALSKGTSVVGDNFQDKSEALKKIKLGDNGDGTATLDTSTIAAWAKRNGYDGVIFENVVDFGLYGENYEWLGFSIEDMLTPCTDVVVFDNDQVIEIDENKSNEEYAAELEDRAKSEVKSEVKELTDEEKVDARLKETLRDASYTGVKVALDYIKKVASEISSAEQSINDLNEKLDKFESDRKKQFIALRTNLIKNSNPNLTSDEIHEKALNAWETQKDKMLSGQPAYNKIQLDKQKAEADLARKKGTYAEEVERFKNTFPKESAMISGMSDLLNLTSEASTTAEAAQPTQSTATTAEMQEIDTVSLLNGVKAAQATANETGASQTVKLSDHAVTAEPKSTTNRLWGFTITDNTEYNSVEIKFNEKPSEAVRNVLKANKFKWNGKKGVWYGRTTHEAINEALTNAYEAEIPSSVLTKGQQALVDAMQEELGGMSSVFPTEIYEEPKKPKPFTGDGIINSKAVSQLAEDIQNGTAPQQAIDTINALPTASEEANNIKENDYGENEDNEGPVLEPEPNGEGASRLLDELQAGDVQGAVGERQSVEPAGERVGQTERDGNKQSSDAGRSRSKGTGESGDIRTGRVDHQGKHIETAEEKQTKDAEIKETVKEQVEQHSKVEPKGSNFVIGESLNLPQGEKARFRANVDAIKLIKQLEDEGRYATAEEQEILAKYVGWGGLSNAFGEMSWNSETRHREMVAKKGWESEFAEFKQLVTDGYITEEEYKGMSASTKNAHYTSIEVVKAMYDGLAQLGFKGGRMLEPSSGVGNFVGGMPVNMSGNVKSWTMVELDRITGLIAKYLYPNADVRIQGFETANIPDNYMDVAIGNVPFGNYGVVDHHYPKRITSAIHNYFFAKTLDKVRPGGVVMFVTSSFTMNGKDNTLRQYIMDRADLLGAIRLPNTAFAGNAGTSVVTDILVLRKRAPGTAYAGEAFLESPNVLFEDRWQRANINEYFEAHPEMVLGTADFVRGMYGPESLTYKPLTDRGTLGEQIREAFKNIKGTMDYTVQATPEKANFAVERAQKKTKNGGLEVGKDGKIYRNENGTLSEVTTDSKSEERIKGLLGIRDAYRTLVNYLQQGQDAKFIKKARSELNKAYDDFVKKYGYINSNTNKSLLKAEPDSYSLLSLENYDADTKKATKADIFTKDTITANKTITHVDDVASGVIVSMNRTGGVDAAYIAKLTGKTEEAVTRELIDSRLAFKNGKGELESPESYLSGNVRAKLREADALAHYDKDYLNNVEALKNVIPKDIPYYEIAVTPGTPWIPNNVYADFIADMLGGYNNPDSYSGPDVTVGRTNTGAFKIIINNNRLKTRYQNTQQYGTKRKSFIDIIEAMMTNGNLTVNDYIEDENGRKVAVLNKVETDAVQAKVEEINKAFQDWLWRDETRRNELASLYNETFNALATPKYNGENLTFNGLSAGFSLREHQANAVQRIISSGGNTLLAHKVGAGKTLEMAAAAMKLRELGIIKKPVFVVPKSLVAQWGVEFKSYFPAAKLLVSDEKSFQAANRKTFINKIANGDYDAIILSYEQFEKVPMSAEYTEQFYQQQINDILDAIAEEKAENGGKGLTVKEMEKREAQLEKKIGELTSKPKDEDNVDFEQLGIDSLFVDEAHNFKNLEYVSRMRNVSGLSNSKSQRAFDLYTKIRYLQGLNGGRGIVFATATPVMNSMAEMYTMQRYLQSDMLEQLGLKTFDAWAKQFGEIVNSIEIKPSGNGFRPKQTFSNFINLNELQLMFRSFADVLTDVPGLKIPKMKGGKVTTVECEPGSFQEAYMQALEKRANNIKNVDPKEDNMLKITSDGRKVSYTQRMIDPSLPYEPGCKIYRCCDNVVAEYKASTGKTLTDPKTGEKVKQLGTQIIFCDMATPKAKSNTKTDTDDSADEADFDAESAQLYDDIKKQLVKKGIPANEIAFIHDANTDAKKKQLYADVNAGKVRVLIGSTGKMGVGMNAQKRIVAIHHLDAPWRPGDVEQRDGRAFRQGNINSEVTKYVYVTKGSFDARLWNILDRKSHFIDQIMNGENVGRTAEDTGQVTLSAAEVMALASGNPLIEEQVKLTADLNTLHNQQKAHNSEVTRAKTKLSEDEQKIGTLENSIEKAKEDIKSRVDTYSEGKFSMTVDGKKYTEKKDAGEALAATIITKASVNGYVTVGKFAGFELRVIKDGTEYSGLVTGAQGYKFNIYPDNTTRMVNHIIGVVEGIESKIKVWTDSLAETKTDLAAQKRIIAEPFAKQAELDQKTARYNEVMAILNPQNEQTIGDTSEDTTQYNDRTNSEEDTEYLSLAAEPEKNKVKLTEMVVAAAKKAGYDKVGFHGTKAQFTKFSKAFSGKNFGNWSAYGAGFYFATNADRAMDWANKAKGNGEARVMPVYLKSQNMLKYNEPITSPIAVDIIKSSSKSFDDYDIKWTLSYASRFADFLSNKGYSQLEIQEVFKSMGYDGIDASALTNGASAQYVVFDPNQIKSAAPVTYDKSGNIIPLSQRFNSENDDTQYEDRREESDTDIISYIQDLHDKGYTPSQIFNETRFTLKANGSILDANFNEIGAINLANTGYRHGISTESKTRWETDSGVSSNVGRRIYDGISEQSNKASRKGWSELSRQQQTAATDAIVKYTLSHETDLTDDLLSAYVSNADFAEFIYDYYHEDSRVFEQLTKFYFTEPNALIDILDGLTLSEEQNQDRTSALSDRDVLSIAASQINVDSLDAGEQDALRIFQDRLTSLHELEQKRADEGRLYRDQQFGANVDREAAKATLERMKVLDGQISKASGEVLKVENTEVLKRVLQKARKVVEATERQHGKELLDRYRDRRNNAAAIKKYRDRIKTDTDTLSKWILHPSNKNALQHVPDALKNSVIPFLTSIDFTSKRQLNGGEATKADEQFVERLKKLRGALKQNMDLQGMYSGYSDLPEGFMDEIQKFIDATQVLADSQTGDFVINQMTSEELKTLSKLVRVVKKLIVNMNSFHQNAMFQHTYDAGDSSIDFMSQLHNSTGTGVVSEFLLWQQMRPAYAFERFGEGGMAIFDEFRRGQATLAFNTQRIKEFAESTYTAEEVKAWESEIKTFTLGGDTVKVPVSYIMGLYELNKRPQAQEHLLGGGLRVATYKNGKVKESDVGHTLTPDDLNKMIGSLTDRQKEVADKLQQYMAKQGGEWGNYVSVARFGEELFGEEHYYPLNSDGRHLDSTADEYPSAASLYSLLNMSFTKELVEKANNRIVLYSIFDVFANHMASMAQYNAFALPVLDSLKWFNYKQVDIAEDGTKTVNASVREQMARAYGVPEESRPGSGQRGYAESFVINIIKAFNGTETQGVPSDSQGLNGLHKYNMAQIAYNFRVVVQQPMAITRAGILLDYSSIIRGLKLSPEAIRKNIAEMQKYSGIAAWKALGFYDVNISRGLADIIKHNESFRDKVGDVGMSGAELADNVTWAAMWSACKEQVIKDRKLKPGDEGFYEAVSDLFEEVVYKTQVVDSVLTKNEFLRSKGWWARAMGSFMSEPTTTASMLVDAYDKYSLDMQRGKSRQQAWKQNSKNIVRTAYVYAIGNILLAAVESLADAWRDDDDYMTFFEKWLDNFGSNLIDEMMPLNKLPILRDVYELIKSMLNKLGLDTYGNEPRSVIFQWSDYLLKGTEIFHDLFSGEDTNYTWYAGCYKYLQALSGITGLPLAAVTREVVGIWNHTVGAMAPSLKVKSYDSGAKNNIKYAYKDGYITEEEAIQKLLDTTDDDGNAIVDSKNDAYWLVKSWETGESSKYGALTTAIKSNSKTDFNTALKELTSHGVSEKDARKQAIRIIDDLYNGTDEEGSSITRYQAMQMLQGYGGYSYSDAEDKVDLWDFIGDNEKYADISIAAVRKYNDYCAGTGMSKETYFNAWSTIKGIYGEDLNGDGKNDAYTAMDKKLAYIGSLPITYEQKYALALASEISEENINKRANW